MQNQNTILLETFAPAAGVVTVQISGHPFRPISAKDKLKLKGGTYDITLAGGGELCAILPAMIQLFRK